MTDSSQQSSGRIEQRGLYLDEFEVGATYYHSPGRTISEGDNILFTTTTMNTQSLHLDAHWSSAQSFGQPLVNSMMTLSTLVGLSVAQLTQGTIVANLGFETVEFPAPVYVGDTLYAETFIKGKRRSATRPGQGIVTLVHTMRNQAGAIVARCTRNTLVWHSTNAPASNRPTDGQNIDSPELIP
ncbi:acyl dehydratase [Arthrobacter crystallopoietes BAB-32]|uniref:Acyl dehydratase n=1 Tax=Arthrobacter crystallopoietes BAB-32 TaxID=1246476 RepID=N1UYQ9_9MICC|nr:MaoC family dehydratase [Arthrobacter crystallopoietes]EMY35531.1 acyl dehydratase [Arthrobacter crystallopoietes BAB-32]